MHTLGNDVKRGVGGENQLLYLPIYCTIERLTGIICVLYLYIYLLSISVYLSLCSQNYHLYLYHIYIYPCTYIYLSSIYGSIYGQTLFSTSLMIRSILWLQGRQRRSQGPRHWNLKIRLHGSIKIKSHRLSGPSRVNSWTCGAFIHETAWSDFKLEIENLARMFMEQLGNLKMSSNKGYWSGYQTNWTGEPVEYNNGLINSYTHLYIYNIYVYPICACTYLYLYIYLAVSRSLSICLFIYPFLFYIYIDLYLCIHP